jgi:hypothetical protein
MPKWTLLALDQPTCGALMELLGGHIADIAGDKRQKAIAETAWAIHLIQLFMPEDEPAELPEMAALILRTTTSQLPLPLFSECTRSRRLSWPGDLAWIEARSNDGQLAGPPPPSATG